MTCGRHPSLNRRMPSMDDIHCVVLGRAGLGPTSSPSGTDLHPVWDRLWDLQSIWGLRPVGLGRPPVGLGLTSSRVLFPFRLYSRKANPAVGLEASSLVLEVDPSHWGTSTAWLVHFPIPQCGYVGVVSTAWLILAPNSSVSEHQLRRATVPACNHGSVQPCQRVTNQGESCVSGQPCQRAAVSTSCSASRKLLK